MPPKHVRLCTRVREVSFLVVLGFIFAVMSLPHSAAITKARVGNDIEKWATRIFVTASLPQGTVAVAYNGALGVRGGAAPYSFSSTGSLPPGVALNPATGIISGTPTAQGIFYFTAFVTDSTGKTADRKLSISVGTGSEVKVQISPTSSTVTSGGSQ